MPNPTPYADAHRKMIVMQAEASIHVLREENERLRRDNAELRKMLHAEKNKPVIVKCDECGGTGYDPDMKDYKCVPCDGSGVIHPKV